MITETFGETLVELGYKNNNIVVLDADLAKATKSLLFKEKFPERFFNMGVAEQDMVSTAIGFATCGKIPFACTFAIFITGNAFPQIRNACISQSNIKLIGVHGGIATGEDGASHQALEDIALMRSLPNMTIIHPCDAIETEQATRTMAESEGVAYMRLVRGEMPTVHDETYKFEIGKGDVIRYGFDITIIATGALVFEAIRAGRILYAEGIQAEIINIHTIKPIDKELIIESAKKTNLVLTCEDHSIIGGLGTAVQEVLSENYPCIVEKIGMKEFGKSGKKEELYEKFGLSFTHIAEKARKMVLGEQ